MSDGADVDGWRRYDLQALSQQYSPSSRVDDFDGLIAAYASRSAESEARAHVRKDLRYGAGRDEALDLFPAPAPDAPLQVYIHGGYWQALSKNDSTFAGAEFVANGVSFAAIDYTLAPHAKIAQMVEQCRQSICWLYRHARELGFDRDKVFLSGSSAGAHLASLVLLTRWEAHGLPADVIKGATLMSGIYDLRPLVHTYVNAPLMMDEAEAVALSPLFMELADLPPITICWGEHETEEFKRQSEHFHQALSCAGAEPARFEVPDCNHFDIVHTLADPQALVGRSAYAQMGRRSPSDGSAA